MTKVTIEFALGENEVTLTDDGKLMVDLGEGVSLVTMAPKWMGRINRAMLQVVMEVEGVPPNAKSEQAPIERTYQAAPDGGQQERQDGGSGEPRS